MGGTNPSTSTGDVIQFATIATVGNFTDFGDRTAGGSYCSGTSNGHGGLG